MNSRLLTDAIVRQTTVLLAELSTASGIRAPLAHIAEQVFASLAREIEGQGVARKVAADMFGLALRTYQKKVQRLEESITVRDKTLWEAVLEYIETTDGVARRDVDKQFEHDEPLALAAVLKDLVGSGLVYVSGRGQATIYRVTSDTERRRVQDQDGREALAGFVWATVFRLRAASLAGLREVLLVNEEALLAAIASLLEDGRLSRDDAAAGVVYRASPFVIPAGAEVGWEAAVFDHFQAVTAAIAAKVRRGGATAADADLLGGTTLRFGLHEGHPYAKRVLGSLARVREEMQGLWDEVTRYNREHPVSEEERTQVTFYFGQSIAEGEIPLTRTERVTRDEEA